jgi:hypothetical protein
MKTGINSVFLSFRYESEFVEEFIAMMLEHSPFALKQFAKEFNYMSGRIDCIACDNLQHLYSFEAKLTKWKDAVHQAFRNTSLSHYSYVILPCQIARSVTRFEVCFAEKRVGLATIEAGKIIILIQAPYNDPIRPWLTDSAFSYLETECYAKRESIPASG